MYCFMNDLIAFYATFLRSQPSSRLRWFLITIIWCFAGFILTCNVYSNVLRDIPVHYHSTRWKEKHLCLEEKLKYKLNSQYNMNTWIFAEKQPKQTNIDHGMCLNWIVRRYLSTKWSLHIRPVLGFIEIWHLCINNEEYSRSESLHWVWVINLSLNPKP